MSDLSNKPPSQDILTFGHDNSYIRRNFVGYFSEINASNQTKLPHIEKSKH